MKLISWNVNGLRACLTHDFAASFAALDADIFSVQETKMQPGQADFAPEGYTEYTYSAEKKGYSGTACWCKTAPLAVTTGIGLEEHDHEGRVITAEFPEYYIVTCYTPNSKDGLARIQQDVLERKPDFCCVMFGTNDVTNAYKGDSALQEYEKNMKQILIRLRESNIETVLMTPGMLCKHRVKGFWGFWWYIHRYFENLQKAGHMDAYVAKIREIANQLDIPIADAYAEWQLLESQGVDTTALLANGLNHPNAEMHKVFANKLYDVIFM